MAVAEPRFEPIRTPRTFEAAIEHVVEGAAFLGLGASSCETLEEQTGTVQVKAPSGHCWSGAFGSRTVDGCGSQSVTIEGETIIVANAQKQDAGNWPLLLMLRIDGEVVDSEMTTAEYGLAMVSEG